jgi:pimeloyl-ACP methyl ester carboxylesterase
MTTNLLEFKSGEDILRGILTKSANSKRVVVMIGGFERAGTTEKKFKILSDKLGAKNIDCFRFDIADCGLSDGNFYEMTIDGMANSLKSAVDYLKKFGYENFSVVGHSLAACAISLTLSQKIFHKIILIAPGLNQRELLRLWFVQKNNKNIEINWKNYKNYLSEADFTENLKFDLTTKSHKLSYKYRSDNKDMDYSTNFSNLTDNVLLIHGNVDLIVPVESLNCDFKNKLIIDKGDHDLERPGIIDQWLDRAVNFLE